MAFWTMSTLVSRSGAILIAASETNNRSSRVSVSSTKTWLIRRLVRRPPSFLTTAASRSSECRSPFITAPASPARTMATALSAATRWFFSSMIRNGDRSASSSRAALAMRSGSPMKIGSIRPRSAASSAPPSELWFSGQTTTVFRRGNWLASARRCENWSFSSMISVGSSRTGISTWRVGASMIAVPLQTVVALGVDDDRCRTRPRVRRAFPGRSR